MKTSSDRIAILDGLRAISILCVVLAHIAGTAGFPLSETSLRWGFIGSLGVRVFFVISGYLITGLLLSEQAATGTLALQRFYLRRSFRIMVPYYAFLLVLMLASRSGFAHLNPGDLLHAVTYTSNYQLDKSWDAGHTWSLAVEEQFYLLWPAVLLLAGKRRGLLLAGLFVLVAPLVRLAEWQFAPSMHPLIGKSFETVGDALAIGCVLAGVRTSLWSTAAYRAFLRSRWFALVPLAVAACVVFDARPRLAFLIGATAMNLGIALCIDWCVRFQASRIGSVLCTRPLVYIGRLSYSIYLWQQLFLDRHQVATWTRFPINVALLALFALASFYLVEQPSMQARHTFEKWVGRRFPALRPSPRALHHDPVALRA